MWWKVHFICDSREVQGQFGFSGASNLLKEYLHRVRFVPSTSTIEKFWEEHEVNVLIKKPVIVVWFSGCQKDSFRGKALIHTEFSRKFHQQKIIERVKRHAKLGLATLVLGFAVFRMGQKFVPKLVPKPAAKAFGFVPESQSWFEGIRERLREKGEVINDKVLKLLEQCVARSTLNELNLNQIRRIAGVPDNYVIALTDVVEDQKPILKRGDLLQLLMSEEGRDDWRGFVFPLGEHSRAVWFPTNTVERVNVLLTEGGSCLV